MNELCLKEISKTYQGQHVLQDINLSVYKEEFIVIIGPSGCGKSTLLRMIAGLEDVSGGKIYLSGKEINHTPPQFRNIAMVFQNYALYPHMSVGENIGLSLKMKKHPKEEIQQRVEEVAQKLKLHKHLERKPSELSGGQKQRVAMGRAMIRNPKLFLFDEPLSNLDASLRNQMRHEIKNLHRAQKVTTLYVTHDQIEAMTLADRIVVLNQGHIQQIGSPHEIFHKPANKFVADFFGAQGMNFFKESDLNSEEFYDFNHKLPLGHTQSSFSYGIRPEHFHLKPLQSSIKVAGKVSELDLLGSSYLLRLKTPLGSRFSCLVPHEDEIFIGDQIDVFCHKKNIHVFHEHLGKRVHF